MGFFFLQILLDSVHFTGVYFFYVVFATDLIIFRSILIMRYIHVRFKPCTQETSGPCRVAEGKKTVLNEFPDRIPRGAVMASHLLGLRGHFRRGRAASRRVSGPHASLCGGDATMMTRGR